MANTRPISFKEAYEELETEAVPDSGNNIDGPVQGPSIEIQPRVDRFVESENQSITWVGPSILRVPHFDDTTTSSALEEFASRREEVHSRAVVGKEIVFQLDPMTIDADTAKNLSQTLIEEVYSGTFDGTTQVRFHSRNYQTTLHGHDLFRRGVLWNAERNRPPPGTGNDTMLIRLTDSKVEFGEPAVDEVYSNDGERTRAMTGYHTREFEWDQWTDIFETDIELPFVFHGGTVTFANAGGISRFELPIDRARSEEHGNINAVIIFNGTDCFVERYDDAEVIERIDLYQDEIPKIEGTTVLTRRRHRITEQFGVTYTSADTIETIEISVPGLPFTETTQLANREPPEEEQA